MILILLLIFLAILILGGGLYTRDHPTYGNYSNGGIGFGTLLIIILVVLVVTGTLRWS